MHADDAWPPITADELNQITSTIIGAAINVHRASAAGLLESAYLQPALCHEMHAARLGIELQKALPLVIRRGVRIDCAYRADLIVEGCVLVEVKAAGGARTRSQRDS